MLWRYGDHANIPPYEYKLIIRSPLSRWGWDSMTAILQMTFWNVFFVWNENIRIRIWISLKFAFNGPMDIKLVEVMAWCQFKPFTCKYFYKKYKNTYIRYHSYIELAPVIEILHKFRRKYVIDDLNLMCISLFSGELITL